MSDPIAYACLTCREYAPELGDGGLLGYPDIAAKASCQAHSAMFEDGAPSFGYLYEALVAVGLRRFDVEEVAAWLRGHQGHRLTLEVGGYKEAMGELDGDAAVDAQAQHLWREAPERLRQALASGRYLRAAYVASCADCHVVVTSDAPEHFLSFPPRQLKPDEAQLFNARWSDADEMSVFRLFGAIDPLEDFMPALLAFLATHDGHRIDVMLRPSGGSSWDPAAQQ